MTLTKIKKWANKETLMVAKMEKLTEMEKLTGTKMESKKIMKL